MYLKWRNIFGTTALAGCLIVVGCAGNNNANVRAVNASPGLPPATVQVGVIAIAAALPYGTEGVQPAGQYSVDDTSGNYRLVGAGTAQAVILYQKPGTNIASTKMTLVKNGYYTIVSTGMFPNVNLMPLTDDDTAPNSNDFKLRIVQTSSSSGPVDFYLTPASGSVNGASPVQSNLQFGQVTNTYLQLTPANYEIQVTPHGNPSSVLAKMAFTPTAGSIHTAFILDPPPGSSSFGVLVTNDPVAK